MGEISPASSQGSSASQSLIQKTAAQQEANNLSHSKTKLETAEKVDFNQAVHDMTKGFGNLASSQSKGLGPLKEKLSDNVNDTQKGAEEKATQIYEKILLTSQAATPTLPQKTSSRPPRPKPKGPQSQPSPIKNLASQQTSSQAISSSTRLEFHYNWGIQGSQLPAASINQQIASAKPEELLHMWAKGISVSADQLMEAAEKYRSTIPPSGKERGPMLTTLHELYAKAADKYETEGHIAKGFEARAKAAEFSLPASSSPLHHMSEAVKAGQSIQKHKMLPAHFTNLDTGTIKRGALHAFNRKIEGQDMTQIEFRLSKFARHDLQGHLSNIQNNLPAFIAALPSEIKGKVHITEEYDTFLGKKADDSFGTRPGLTPFGAKAIQVDFEGIGTVSIGNNVDVGCLYENVRVFVKSDLPPGKAEAQVHQMLTMLGVGSVLNERRVQDEERLKTAMIFRAYFPREAIRMERTREFYEMPLDMLKAKITSSVPEMKDILKKYDDNPQLIKKIEIYPGKTTFALTDISAQMRAKGAYGLMVGVGHNKTEEQAANSVVHIIQNGALSSQDRFQAGIFEPGVSSDEDLASGGGDSVFTRLINKNIINAPMVLYPFGGYFQVLYDLDACNTGAYGYGDDTYGVRSPGVSRYDRYEQRENLIDLASKIDRPSNEVMVKNTISPSMIRGVVCGSQTGKDILVQKLTTQGAIVNGMINGKPVDSFIHIANKFNEQMWNT